MKRASRPLRWKRSASSSLSQGEADDETPLKETVVDTFEHGLLGVKFVPERLVPFLGPKLLGQLLSGLKQSGTRRPKVLCHVIHDQHVKPSLTHQLGGWGERGHLCRTQLRRANDLRGCQTARGVDDIAGNTTARLEDTMTFSQHGELVRDSTQDIRVNNRCHASRLQRQGATVRGKDSCDGVFLGFPEGVQRDVSGYQPNIVRVGNVRPGPAAPRTHLRRKFPGRNRS